ncbi:MAG: ATP-dependent nuclease [Pleomorphochaeta sp.]
MYISKVSLRNYRNFSNAKFLFKKDINTIIGENGSGKTNLFRAIRLLLDDNMYRYAYRFQITDFNRALNDWRGHWIIISIEFSEISSDESIQALFNHALADFSENHVEKASYTLFFKPKDSIRKRLEELSTEGNVEDLKKSIASIDISDYETTFWGKSNCDFNDDEIYKELVGDFDNLKFKFKIDHSKFGCKIPNQLSVSSEISFTYIKALRDVLSDFNAKKTNPLLSILNNIDKEKDKNKFDDISILITNVNEKIEKLETITKIKDDIYSTLNHTVGDTYSPSSLSIKSALSEDPNNLLKELRIFIGEPFEDYEGDINEMSLGGANIIYLSLKLLENYYKSKNNSIANFLIIEEPEAHIHTHIQKSVFDKINYSNTQIIYSTHSTFISEACRISRMNILSKDKNLAQVFQPSIGLDTNQISKIERYLDAIRCNVLFAKGVVLVEGDAEEILIPILVKKILGLSLDELGISLVNIRSVGFKNIAYLFSEKRIKKRCSIITDLDKSIDEKGVAAEKLGEERKIILDEFVNNNDWVSVFYADYTFEIEFVKCGNTEEICNTINDIYKQEPIIENYIKKIKSDNIVEYGNTVVDIAKIKGKGWFALNIAKNITENTKLPKYIFDAILFAKKNIKYWIPKIIQYRLSVQIKLNNNSEFEVLLKNLKQLENNEIELTFFLDRVKELKLKDPILNLLEEDRINLMLEEIL